jgi:hypothetical protein
MHTRLISVAFSLSLYTTFSHPYSLLKPCGYCTCLIIMKHVQFSPNLYTTWHVLLNDLRDLRKWRKCKSFLLQVDVAGDGSTKTNIKMNTKWICNTSRSHPTSTPHDTFYVIISRDLRAWRTFKLAFPSTGWRCWAGNGSTKTDIKMNIKWLRLKRYSLFTNWHFESFDSFLRWMNKSSILNCLKDSRLLWKYSSTTLSKFQTNDQSILMMCTQLSLFRNVLCWTPTKKRFHLAVKPNTYNLQTEITIREQLDF